MKLYHVWYTCAVMTVALGVYNFVMGDYVSVTVNIVTVGACILAANLSK